MSRRLVLYVGKWAIDRWILTSCTLEEAHSGEKLGAVGLMSVMLISLAVIASAVMGNIV